MPFSIGLVTMAFRPAVAALVPLADGVSPQTTSLPARTLAAIMDKEVFPITAHVVENVKAVRDAPGGAFVVLEIQSKKELLQTTWAALVAVQDYVRPHHAAWHSWLRGGLYDCP